MTSSCPLPPDMDDCKSRKKRCLSGPCVGFAYTEGEECAFGYEFNPATCQCDPVLGPMAAGTYKATNFAYGGRQAEGRTRVYIVVISDPWFDGSGRLNYNIIGEGPGGDSSPTSIATAPIPPAFPPCGDLFNKGITPGLATSWRLNLIPGNYEPCGEDWRTDCDATYVNAPTMNVAHITEGIDCFSTVGGAGTRLLISAETWVGTCFTQSESSWTLEYIGPSQNPVDYGYCSAVPGADGWDSCLHSNTSGGGPGSDTCGL